MYKWLMNIIVVALVLQSATGCNWMSPSDDSPYNHIFREEEAHLTDDVSSPFCDFSIDYTYLEEDGDSIAALINRTIQREWLGDEYASLPPVEAVDSFKNVYIRNYRKETSKMYSVDKAKTTYDEAIPQWYSRTYSMVSIWHLLSELLNHSEFTKQVAAYAALPWCLPSFFLLFPSLCHLILPSQLHHLREAFPSTLKLGEVFVFCDL